MKAEQRQTDQEEVDGLRIKKVDSRDKATQINPLKGSGGRRLHFEVFSAIQV